MANEHEPLASESWDRVASELRACRESQHHAWGTLDNATLGCYLAGGGDDDERRAVEQALADHPQLRELTDLVRDVLVEFEPATAAPLGPTPPTLPFTTVLPASPRSTSRRWPSRVALVAAACLLLTLGVSLRPSDARGPAADPAFTALTEATAKRQFPVGDKRSVKSKADALVGTGHPAKGSSDARR